MREKKEEGYNKKYRSISNIQARKFRNFVGWVI